MRDLKSPAPIPDQGLFRAIFNDEISIECEGLLCSDNSPGAVEK